MRSKILILLFVLAITSTLNLTIYGGTAGIVWTEAEKFTRCDGQALLINPQTSDYGRMAENEASGRAFIRIVPKTRLFYDSIRLGSPQNLHVWVRAFALDKRRITIFIDGRPVGTSLGGSNSPRLVWSAMGTVSLKSGTHTLELRAAKDNTQLAYVDAITLIPDERTIPIGKNLNEMARAATQPLFQDDFTYNDMSALASLWSIRPPNGNDATVELVQTDKAAHGSALHIHNGTGTLYTLTTKTALAPEPRRQVTARVRVRKGTLCEYITLTIPGVGSFSPQLYRHYTTVAHTWLIPPSARWPLVLQISGRGGGDTYIDEVEFKIQDPPLSSFATGAFLPPPNLYREGRLFEIERYVINTEAFTEADADSDRKWSLCRLSREDNRQFFSRGTVLKSDSIMSDRPSPESGCPPLQVRVGPLESGKYHVFLSDPGRDIAYSTDGHTWQRFRGGHLPELGIIKINNGWFEFWLDDRYAEPNNPGPTYADYIRFMPVEDPAFTKAPAPKPKPLAHGQTNRDSVWLSIINPYKHPRLGEPVRSGVPIKRGRLASAEHITLTDTSDHPVQLQASVTGRWLDGSVKWLLLDFPATLPTAGTKKYRLDYGNEVQRANVPDERRISISESEQSVTLDTGALRVVIDKTRCGRVAAFLPGDDKPCLVLKGAKISVANGEILDSARRPAQTVTIEDAGPLHAVVRVQGKHVAADGYAPLGFDMRIHVFAARPELFFEYGFVMIDRSPKIALRSVSLVFEGDFAKAQAILAAGLNGKACTAIPVEQEPYLTQIGKNPFGADIGSHFEIRASGTDKPIASGERTEGWLALSGKGTDVVAIMPYFWQQFPKGLRCSGSGFEVELWPSRPGIKPFVANQGMAKSHQLGITLAPGGTLNRAARIAAVDRWREPLFAVAPPEYYCGSGVFSELVPRRQGFYPEYEAIVDAAFDHLLTKRAGYGMENWGDVWQGGYVRGAKIWSNQEWDLADHWIVQFARTGNLRFLRFASEATRHFADVDCIHFSTNPAIIGGSRMHCHTSLVGHQLEGPTFSHAGWVEGMINNYHLTGDRRGLEASTGIADYIARNAPYCERHRPQGPLYNLMIQRPAGWPLTTLCLVYRTTWNPKYIETARRIVDYARRCQDPERGAWDAQTGHEQPYRGGCVFAYTLLRGNRLYYELTGDERALRDYAAAARWILCELWRPGHRFLYEQCPRHEPGTRVPFILSEMEGYATRITGNPIFATMGRQALAVHAAGGTKSWMVERAAAAQWGNGILEQLPRMLYDWEAIGLSFNDRVTLIPSKPVTRVTSGRQTPVRFVLENESDLPLEQIQARVMIRGDWTALVRNCPTQVAADSVMTVEVTCQSPPRIRLYELQNDIAYLHVAVTYRSAKRHYIALASAKLSAAGSLELDTPPSVALKPGTTTRLRFTIMDRTSAQPNPKIEVLSDLEGIEIGKYQFDERPAKGEVVVSVSLRAPDQTAVASGDIEINVTSGIRSVRGKVPVNVGRFRALLIENDMSDEWHYPFQAVLRYPGIAVAYMSSSRVKSDFPRSSAEIAKRWETVILGETGEGSASFLPEQLQALSQFVHAGGGLMTVGGARCYTPGGYAQTPLAAVLPVDLSDGRYIMMKAFVARCDPKSRLFEGYQPDFPPFGAYQSLTPKNGATILAEFSNGKPFITRWQVGKGRVLSLGTVWNHGPGMAFKNWKQYGRFIGRSIRWTAGDL